MSDGAPSYTCGSCGRSYGARPIHCECGARFDREGLTRVQAQAGGIGIDVLRVAEPAAFTPPKFVADTVERLQSALGGLAEALAGSDRAAGLLRTAMDAIERLPAALEHDRYQDAVSAHQRLVLRGASEAEVHASYEALMARLATLPPE